MTDKAKRYVQLATTISKSQKVNSFNAKEYDSGSSIASGLLDMGESFEIISKKYLPMLSSDNISEEELNDILFDIGEELRHIIYHLNDMKYYGYLKSYIE